ncbi:undecaprenyl-diphosphate phosphatase [Myceligenerans crystallogenes]|uniref:Undecaprenyl-diphosphatase n=1 Tax=Myceligenerans crystallogenes TaxID=316335 RepID=A0ABN2NIG9_9MICO
MTTWQAILLGLVQGLTEFLPVSSSAHMRITSELIGAGDAGAAFTAITQLGTETAVVIYYRKKLAQILGAWWRALTGGNGPDWRSRLGVGPAAGSVDVRHARPGIAVADPDAAMGWYIILGSIPIVALGLLFDDYIEHDWRNLWLTVAMLAGFGVVILWADRTARQERDLESLTPRSAITYGIAQSLALVPGVSRSGGTIAAGLFMGFKRSAAADYSFLLALPAVFGAGFYQLVKTLGEPLPEGAPSWPATIIATVVAGVVGYFVIVAFLKIVKRYSFAPFVYYRFVLAAVVAVLLVTGVVDPQGGVH